jgi:putative ligand-binding protein with streptavidin-like fold
MIRQIRARGLSAALATVFILLLAGPLMASAERTPSSSQERTGAMPQHPYVGMWVTGDGHIRQELLPEGRYDEARGNRKSAYRGSYAVTGNRIDYVDDTGFTADGVFVDENTLHHGGMIFYREK